MSSSTLAPERTTPPGPGSEAAGPRPLTPDPQPPIAPAIQNPDEQLLRMDRMPHIWCPGCGIGTTVNCFARAPTGWRAAPRAR